MSEDYGVVIITMGRCVFASALMTLDDASRLAVEVGGTVVGAQDLRMFKRAQLEPRSAGW